MSGLASKLRRAAQILSLDAPFTSEAAGVVDEVRIAYEVVGPESAPIVVVLGGISATSHVAAHAGDPRPGWWDRFVGPLCAIDTERYAVLSVDWLGGGGLTMAEAGEARLVVTPRDQARLLAKLLAAIGVLDCDGGPGDPGVAAVVGSSYGGMVALALLEDFPRLTKRLGLLCTAHRTDPWMTGLRSLQRRVLRLAEDGRPELEAACVSIARGLGMLSYRSRDEFAERFSRQPPVDAAGAPRFEVEHYLEARGRAFAASASAQGLYTLSQSIDLAWARPESVMAATDLLSVTNDLVVDFDDALDLAARLPCLRSHVSFKSRYGHDAFLKEEAIVAAFLRNVLEEVA